jgi:hypothetical protein
VRGTFFSGFAAGSSEVDVVTSAIRLAITSDAAAVEVTV